MTKQPGSATELRARIASPAIADVAVPLRPSRSQAAYQQLKADIMRGIYAPNQRLIEADLTRDLMVSRVTARAVLLRLQQEGLVEMEANRGARVRAFTRDEAINILRVREVLEGLAASLAASRGSAEQLAELAHIVEGMEHAIVAGDLLGYSALNGRFHGTIHEAAADDTLARSLAALHFPLVRYRFRTVLSPGRKEVSLAEHRAIFLAIQARDAEAAERAARHHVAQVRAALAKVEGAVPF